MSLLEICVLIDESSSLLFPYFRNPLFHSCFGMAVLPSPTLARVVAMRVFYGYFAQGTVLIPNTVGYDSSFGPPEMVQCGAARTLCCCGVHHVIHCAISNPTTVACLAAAARPVHELRQWRMPDFVPDRSDYQSGRLGGFLIIEPKEVHHVGCLCTPLSLLVCFFLKLGRSVDEGCVIRVFTLQGIFQIWFPLRLLLIRYG